MATASWSESPSLRAESKNPPKLSLGGLILETVIPDGAHWATKIQPCQSLCNTPSLSNSRNSLLRASRMSASRSAGSDGRRGLVHT